MRSTIPLLVFLFALSVSAAGQEKKVGDLIDCTSPGVLAADGVKIDPPVRLIRANLVRDGSVDAVFAGASDRTLCLKVGGMLFHSTPFVIVNKYRITESGSEWAESKRLPIDSAEAQAVTKFLRGWFEGDVTEEKRSRIDRVMKLPREEQDKEFDLLSDEDQNIYRIEWFVEEIGKGAKKSKGTSHR